MNISVIVLSLFIGPLRGRGRPGARVPDGRGISPGGGDPGQDPDMAWDMSNLPDAPAPRV